MTSHGDFQPGNILQRDNLDLTPVDNSLYYIGWLATDIANYFTQAEVPRDFYQPLVETY